MKSRDVQWTFIAVERTAVTANNSGRCEAAGGYASATFPWVAATVSARAARYSAGGSIAARARKPSSVVTLIPAGPISANAPGLLSASDDSAFAQAACPGPATYARNRPASVMTPEHHTAGVAGRLPESTARHVRGTLVVNWPHAATTQSEVPQLSGGAG